VCVGSPRSAEPSRPRWSRSAASTPRTRLTASARARPASRSSGRSRSCARCAPRWTRRSATASPREQPGAEPTQRRHIAPRTLVPGGLAAPLGGGGGGPPPEAPGMKLSELGELGLLAELERRGLAREIENDAAELAGGIVVTQDALVEGVHFRLDWISWRDLGWRAAAVNLSDLAASGATPDGLVVSLALPADTSAMLDLSDGLAADAQHIADRSGCRLVIDLDRVPLAPGARLEDLGFGEDYELLAALPDPPDHHHEIGRCEPGEGVELLRD